jgi:hypothetical protein
MFASLLNFHLYFSLGSTTRFSSEAMLTFSSPRKSSRGILAEEYEVLFVFKYRHYDQQQSVTGAGLTVSNYMKKKSKTELYAVDRFLNLLESNLN